MDPVSAAHTLHSATSSDSGVANRDALDAQRDNFGKRMAIEVTVVRDLTALRAMESEWRALAGLGPSI
ncbi:MAG: hypothetical protein ABI591_01385, partial [Kofleriaceae bacterium]